MDTWMTILFFGSALILGAMHIRYYRQLRVLLRKYGRCVAFSLSNDALLRDEKEAQKLIKELGDTPESKNVKVALWKADVSFFSVFAALFLVALVSIFLHR